MMNGRDLDISAFKEVAARPEEAGAKAEADPARAAAARQEVSFTIFLPFVYCMCT
jgi:hypothetical protein